MHDPFQWSIGLGCWHGLAIRLHVFFLAFAAATLYLFWPTDMSGPAREANSYLIAAGQMLGIASTAVAVLFFSVLAHELSHWWAARGAGLAPDTIVIGPLGGLTSWRGPASPHRELAIWAAGPLANLLLSVLLATVVMIQNPDRSFAGLLNPLQPGGLEVGTPRVIQVLAIASWINLLLCLVNSLPGYPFDGGRILRSALSVALPSMGSRRVAALTFWVSVTFSVGIAAIALMLWKNGADSLSRTWLALLLLSVVLLVGARQEADANEISLAVEALREPAAEGDEDSLEAGPSDGAPFLAPARADTDWESEEDLAAEPPRREATRAEEEELVDGILSRLHAHGMDSLTADERALLQRVSARYRSRLGRRT